MVQVKVVAGDITQVESDALITAINSSGLWFGGIDRAIQRVAGDHYHSQIAQTHLQNLTVAIAAGSRRIHQGQFNNVIFVVDDLKSKLREIVTAGLDAVHRAGFKSVTLPTIRMGVMLGVVENSVEEVINEMAEGVRDFRVTHADTSLETITFVVYNDPAVEEKLRTAITKKEASKMSEYFFVSNSTAAPLFSDRLDGYVWAENPQDAVERVRAKYSHPAGLYAMEVYANADDYHKDRGALAVWLHPAAEARENGVRCPHCGGRTEMAVGNVQGGYTDKHECGVCHSEVLVNNRTGVIIS